jgi:intracellular septation protein A
MAAFPGTLFLQNQKKVQKFLRVLKVALREFGRLSLPDFHRKEYIMLSSLLVRLLFLLVLLDFALFLEKLKDVRDTFDQLLFLSGRPCRRRLSVAYLALILALA